MVDVLVVGSGPSGLAAAAALCDAGLTVACLAPEGRPTLWPNTYGVWSDEVAPLGYAGTLARTWTATTAHFGRGEVKLGRTYGRFDNDLLRSHLLYRCERGKMRWLEGVAAEVDHKGAHSEVRCRDGTTYAARLVIDTSGHVPVLVKRPEGRPPAFQTAYGVLGTFSTSPIPEGQMLLMDYRDAFLTEAERREPTFLYAMDMGGGLFFVEETSLARRPALPLEVLENRLSRRLAYMGAEVEETLEVERCRFPMGLPLPDLTQRVVGFGGAASMVHPASGYMVASVLRTAPQLAGAIASELRRTDATPQRAAEAAWRAVWSEARVRQRNLYLFGLEALLTFDGPQLRDFFTAFFRLPPERWQGYLSGTLNTGEVMRTMLAMFAHTSNRVRLPLVRSALGRNRKLLFRAVL